MNAEQEACLIAALRGVAEPSAAAEPAALAGQRLRGLMLAEIEADTATTGAAADAALLARLRAHGAFKQPGRLRWPRWQQWIWLPSLASALGAGLLWLRPSAPPLNDDSAASQMRGAEQAQPLAVADPATTAAELQALFATHQLALRRVDLPGAQGIELQALVPPGHAALREALAARGITVPTHGRLFLRVVMAK